MKTERWPRYSVYKIECNEEMCVLCVCLCMRGHDGLSDKKRGTIIRPSPTQNVGCVTVRVCAAFPIEMRQNGGIQILIIPFPSGGAKAAFQSDEDKKKTHTLSLLRSLSFSLHDMNICWGEEHSR